MGSVLVTGAAGFIGYHVSERLLARGETVLGLDNFNAYYDVRLKESRADRLARHPRFRLLRADVADRTAVEECFAQDAPDRVVHLAAQAGVRHSFRDPHAYGQANLVGFLNVLDACAKGAIRHLVFASSSSVYGGSGRVPFSVHEAADHPISLYAATKRANELMAHAYSHLHRLPVTGLRFFTVYGPWGRPDMAIFTFTKAILEGRPLEVFHEGRLRRDFTYVDDVVDVVERVVDRVPAPDPEWSPGHADPATSNAPFRLYNVGHNEPVGLLHLIEVLERELGTKAEKQFLPLPPGDVLETHADIEDVVHTFGLSPRVSLETGIARFVAWYRDYYGEGARRSPALGRMEP